MMRGRRSDQYNSRQVGSAPCLAEALRDMAIYSAVRNLNCAAVKGTTLKRPCRARGDSENSWFALASASVTGFELALPALIVTFGFFTSAGSTETTVAVPTALFSSPVW